MNTAEASSLASGLPLRPLPLRPCNGAAEQSRRGRSLLFQAALAGTLALGATAARAQTQPDPPDVTVRLTAHQQGATCDNLGPEPARTRDGGPFRLFEGEEIVLVIRAMSNIPDAAQAVTGVSGAVSIARDPTILASDFSFTSTNLQLAGGSIGLRAGDFSRADYRLASIQDCLLVRLEAVDDNIQNERESLRLQLLDMGTGMDRITVLGRDGIAMPVTAGLADPNPVVEIVIEEPTRYTLRAEQASVEEDRANDMPGNEVVFVAEVQGSAPSETMTLHYRLSGTATPGTNSQDARDYTAPADATIAGDPAAATGTLTFLRGSRSPQRLRLPVRADNLAEEDETVILHLYRQGPGIDGRFAGIPIVATTTATLTDNDQTTASVALRSGASATIDERENARFTVTLSGALLLPDTTVSYNITGDVTAADYDDPTGGTLTFPSTMAFPSDTLSFDDFPNCRAEDRNGTTVFCDLDILALTDDAADENDETMTITITGASAGAASTSQASASVTIRASTMANHIVSVRSATASQSEDITTATFNIEVTSSTPRINRVRVNYRLGGTATENLDYTLPADSDTIILASNQLQIPITISDDSLNEAAETVVMTLIRAVLIDNADMVIGNAGISAANGEATVAIGDDDPLAVSVVRTDSGAITEGAMTGATATFTVSVATGPMSTAPVAVRFTISGVGITDSDYRLDLSGGAGDRLDISAGETSGTIAITALADTFDEPVESLTLTLAGASSAGTVSVPMADMAGATATVNIINAGDGSGVSDLMVNIFNDGVGEAMEGTNTEFFVVLTTLSSDQVSVMYTASTSVPNPRGGATLPDLDTAQGTVFIPAGQRGGRIRIHVRQDQQSEAEETLTVELTSAARMTGADISLGNTFTATTRIPANAAHVRAVRVASPNDGVLETLPITRADSAAFNVNEGDAAAFRLNVEPLAASTGLHSVDLTVCYSLMGTATGGLRDAADTDYVSPATAPAGSCPAANPPIPLYSTIIPAGQASAIVRLETVNDNVAERDENIVLRILSVAEASTDATGKTYSPLDTDPLDPSNPNPPDPLPLFMATATIADDDGVRISLSGPGRVAEGEEVSVMVQLRGGARTVDVLADYVIALDDDGITGSPTIAVTGDAASLSGTLTFAMNENSKTFSLTPMDDGVDESADRDFIVVTLSNNMPPETTNISAPNPLRIRITDEADDPRLRAQRLEVAGAMLGRAATLLAIPTIQRRLDPGAGPSAPGLQLTVDGRQVVAGGGTEGVAPAPFTGIGIVMPAEDPTLQQLLNAPEGGGDDDGIAALRGLEGIVIAAAPEGDSLSLRQILGASGFALASNEGARTGTAVWGRGGHAVLEGEPVIGGKTVDYKGDAWTFYLGADRRYGSVLIGLAAGYTHGELELDAEALPGLPGVFTFKQDLFSIVPYAAWQPSQAVSVWALGGYGRGGVDITEVDDAGLRREGKSDSQLLLGAAGLTLRRPSQTPVDMLLRLSTTAAQNTIEGGTLVGASDASYRETKTDLQQVHAEFELAARFGAMEGTWVRPFLLLGAAQDFGDAVPDAVTGELGGGFDLEWPKLGLRSNLKAQARLTNKDGDISRRKYKEYVLTGALHYDPGSDQRGLILSLQPEFGAAADTVLGGAAATDATAGVLQRSLRRALRGELAYGIGNARFWGAPGILTIYGNGAVAGRQRHYGSGLRFESGRFALSAGAKRAWSDNGRPGYEFLLDGEYSF